FERLNSASSRISRSCASHQKTLDFGVSHPYNRFCAVQQNRGLREALNPGPGVWRGRPQPSAAGRLFGCNQPSKGRNTMYNATDQFAEINKAGYDNAVKLASMSLEKAERLTKLNLQAAKVALEQGVYSANAVAGIRDVQELFTLRAKLTEAGVQNAIGYSRGVYEIASEAQADLSAL